MNILEKTKEAGRQYECIFYDLAKKEFGFKVESFDFVHSKDGKNARGIFIINGEMEKINSFLKGNPLPRYLEAQPLNYFQNKEGTNAVLASAEDRNENHNKSSISLFFEERKKSKLSDLFSKILP